MPTRHEDQIIVSLPVYRDGATYMRLQSSFAFDLQRIRSEGQHQHLLGYDRACARTGALDQWRHVGVQPTLPAALVKVLVTYAVSIIKSPSGSNLLQKAESVYYSDD